jgi:hypothetical protein
MNNILKLLMKIKMNIFWSIAPPTPSPPLGGEGRVRGAIRRFLLCIVVKRIFILV